ncbi:MAG: PKD domain-containing protein [Patescibacteria group bacterium]
MNKFVLAGVVAILVVAGCWWYFNQSSVPTISETMQLPTSQPNTRQETKPTKPDGTVSKKALKFGKLFASVSSGPAPLQVRFSAPGVIPTGQESSFRIDFGDGKTEKGTAFTCFETQCVLDHTYSSPGTYRVDLYTPGPSPDSPHFDALVYGTITITVNQ